METKTRDFDELSVLHEPTKRNYTKLSQEYNQLVTEMNNLKEAHKKVQEDFKQLKVIQNTIILFILSLQLYFCFEKTFNSHKKVQQDLKKLKLG